MSTRFLRREKFLTGLLSKYENRVNNCSKFNLEQLLDWDLYDLLYLANRVRERYCGNKIKFCSIVNARSGRCSEDCKFCVQSSHYETRVEEYDLKEPQEILSAAKDAQRNGARRFGIVTSGRGLTSERDWERIYETIRLLKEKTSLTIDASLGCLDVRHAALLKEAGLSRYHHNVETSPQFFPNICTTHRFQERLDTVKAVKDAGLELCCGGIFGLGELWDDRIELAYILRDLEPNSIPLNFLHPIPGTPLEKVSTLSPQEILRIIAIFRMCLPSKDISVCGGREYNLRSLQSWMFYAGANATMLGNYLTTTGNPPEEDLRMIEDLGLFPELS